MKRARFAPLDLARQEMCSSAVAVPHSRESLCFHRCAAPPSMVGRTGRRTADQQTDHNHSDTSGARTDGRSIGQTPVMYPSPRCQWHQNRKGQCPAWFSSPVARIGSAYTQDRGNSTKKKCSAGRTEYIYSDRRLREETGVCWNQCIFLASPPPERDGEANHHRAYIQTPI